MKRLLTAIALTLTTITPAAAEALPRWSVACEAKKRDQFGEKSRHFCSLLVFNSKGNGSLVMDDGRTFVMNSRIILEIDARGPRLMKPPKGNYCPASTLRVAVDGKRIDMLPSPQQLTALRSGQTFVWEEQADWPSCQNKAPHGTTLHGFPEALADLERRYRAIER